ncbi:MAG TPA: response regulator transcription factor, partial [Propionibacteriaceae bacterium]|nr:response regulator transcription factor [Propionibacteriaceae bacterium]
MSRVLLVDDDPTLVRALSINLRARAYDVHTAGTGATALAVAAKYPPDVVILDLGLPDMDGSQVITGLRGWTLAPILVLSAREAQAAKVAALDAGADDYVVKPFGLDHVAARIRAVLRRGLTSGDDPVIRVGDLAVDPRSRRVTLGGAEIDLTRKEFDLLYALASRKGEVVSKRTLLAEVWQQAYGGGDRTVDVHLSWLRRKLG